MERIAGIVLDVKKHNDRNNIVTLYTRSRGRMTFVSPVGTGRSAAARYARLLPLSAIETDVNVRAGQELQRLGAVAPLAVWHDIYSNPAKQAIALFLSEFLNRLLRESAPDERMWDFIFNSIRLLDNMEKATANFHLAFLISLMPYSGIFPDTSGYEEGDSFDMRSASFEAFLPAHGDCLTGDEARAVVTLSRMTFYNARLFRLTPPQRTRALRQILKYYSIHYPGTSQLKSLDILTEIFSFQSSLKIKNR